MLKSWIYEFSTVGESTRYVNHCQTLFPETSHVIKILFNGGFTKNGVHPLIPTDTDLFTIFLKDGSTLKSTEFLGLADLGKGTDQSYKEYPEAYQTDSDNYLDLCLKVFSVDNIEGVQIKSGAVYPPRGTSANFEHKVGVENLGQNFPYMLENTLILEEILSIQSEQIIEIILAVVGVMGLAIGIPAIYITVELIL